MQAIKELFAGIVLGLVMAGMAHAATVNLINLRTISQDPSNRTVHTQFNAGARGSGFNDQLDFNTGAAGTLGGSATRMQLDISPGGGIEWNVRGLGFSIYNDSSQLLAASSGAASVVITGLVLSAGNYYAILNGEIRGSLNGAYTFVASAPVSLPAAVWLLAASLIGSVAIARRKRDGIPEVPPVAA